MKEFSVILTVTLFFVCNIGMVQAENEAIYHVNSGVLHIPKVLVGSTYYEVDMQQIEGTLNFDVIRAVEISPVLNSCYSIPTKSITIDGNFDDWQNVPIFVEDRLDEVDGINIQDIHKAYIATDDEYLYFRIDLREDVGNFAAFKGNCRFESYDSVKGVDRWFVANINSNNLVHIQDVYDYGATEIVKTYIGFSAFRGNKIEFKIRKADLSDFDIYNKFMTVTVFNGNSNINDTTIDILISEACVGK